MRGHQRAEVLRDLLDQLTEAHFRTAIGIEELRKVLHPDLNPDHPVENSNGSASRPMIDATTFAVIWRDRACTLGNTVLFRLFQRLLRRPGHFVSCDHLLRDVWNGNIRSPDTIRSAVRHLKSRLRRARMHDLARAIQCEGQHYALLVKSRNGT
jgi:DNA-binding response OmpR family regulator